MAAPDVSRRTTSPTKIRGCSSFIGVIDMKTGIRSVLLATAALALCACGSEPKARSPDQRDMLRRQAEATLSDFRAKDESLDPLMGRAYAYVVFPEIVTAAV